MFLRWKKSNLVTHLMWDWKLKSYSAPVACGHSLRNHSYRGCDPLFSQSHVPNPSWKLICNHYCFLAVKRWCCRICFTPKWLCVPSIWSNTFWCLHYFSFSMLLIPHLTCLHVSASLNDVVLTPKNFKSNHLYWGVSTNIIQAIKSLIPTEGLSCCTKCVPVHATSLFE